MRMFTRCVLSAVYVLCASVCMCVCSCDQITKRTGIRLRNAANHMARALVKRTFRPAPPYTPSYRHNPAPKYIPTWMHALTIIVPFLYVCAVRCRCRALLGYARAPARVLTQVPNPQEGLYWDWDYTSATLRTRPVRVCVCVCGFI